MMNILQRDVSQLHSKPFTMGGYYFTTSTWNYTLKYDASKAVLQVNGHVML